MKREVDTCSVVDQGCDSPANLTPPQHVRATCYSCGQPVCTKCSSKRRYLRYGIRRVCNSCQIERLDGGSSARIERRILRRP